MLTAAPSLKTITSRAPLLMRDTRSLEGAADESVFDDDTEWWRFPNASTCLNPMLQRSHTLQSRLLEPKWQRVRLYVSQSPSNGCSEGLLYLTQAQARSNSGHAKTQGKPRSSGQFGRSDTAVPTLQVLTVFIYVANAIYTSETSFKWCRLTNKRHMKQL